MINKIQMSEKKVNPVASPTKPVTPLTLGRGNSNSNSDLKALKKLRSPKYIATLQEIGTLLQELSEERLKLHEGTLKNQAWISEKDHYRNETAKNETTNTQHETIKIENIQSNPEASTDEVDANEETLESKLLNVNTNRLDRYFETYVEQKQTMVTGQVTAPISNSKILELEKKIEEKLKELAKENEKINDLISIIYPSDREEYLIGCGIISAPGRPVYSREEMSMGVDDPVRAAQLEKGYDVYYQYCHHPDFLCIEIYMDAFCAIYMDGVAKVIKG